MTTTVLDEFLRQTTSLRALARALVGEAAADDVLQETAVRTLTAPPRRPGPVSGWLVAVVRNLARKEQRAERTRRRHEAGAACDPVAPTGSAAEDADTLHRLTRVLTALPEPYRGTILARYLREQTPSEIAAATRTPVRTVKTRLQRGLAILRQELHDRDDDWRRRLVVAFALEPAVPTFFSKATIMKLLVLSALLFPTGWWLSADQGGVQSAAPEATSVAVVEPASPASPTRGSSAVAPVTHDEGVPGIEGAAPTNPTAAPPPPAVPLMRLDLAGPALLCDAFRSTNLGGLFASEAGGQLARRMLARFEAMWQQWDGRADEFRAARGRVLDYAGRIRVLWLLQPGSEDSDDRLFGALTLAMDGHTDMAALAGDLGRVMRGALPGEATDQSVGEFALQLLAAIEGETVTLPVVVEGNLIAFFGARASLAEDVPRCLEALVAAGPPAAAPVEFRVDLSQLRQLKEMRRHPVPARLFGIESLESFVAVARPNGPHAEIELEVEFGDGPRGLFAGLLPDVGTLPALLGRLPMAATPWLTVPFRPDVSLRTVLEVAAQERSDGGGLEAVRQETYDEMGLYLDTELLDHLGGEVMILGDLWQADDRALFREGEDPPLGACIAFSLRDTAAFRRGFDKLLDHLKGAVTLFETREVQGVEISRVGSAFTTGIHLAVGQDLCAIGFGDEGVAQLEALVAVEPGPGRPPLPAAVQRVAPLAPDGWNGVGLADLQALFGGQITLALELLEDSLPRPMRPDLASDENQERLDELLPLVVEHQLDQLVTMTGYDEGVWRLRLLW